MDSVPVKRCSRCGEERPATLEFFYRKKGGRYGLDAQCAECKRAASTTDEFRQSRRQKYSTDSEGAKKASRAYRAANRELVNERKRRFYSENKDILLERSKQYVEQNREAVTERRRRYYQENKDAAKLYRKLNADKLSAQKRERYRRSSEMRQKNAEYGANYRQNNRVKVAEDNKRWYMLHREQFIFRSKEWRARNPERVRCYRANTRAKRKAAAGIHSKEDIARILQSQLGKCFYCEVDIESSYHVDHFIPLARGGSNWPENLRIACPSCNLRKFTKLPHEFMPDRFPPPNRQAAD